MQERDLHGNAFTKDPLQQEAKLARIKLIHHVVEMQNCCTACPSLYAKNIVFERKQARARRRKLVRSLTQACNAHGGGGECERTLLANQSPIFFSAFGDIVKHPAGNDLQLRRLPGSYATTSITNRGPTRASAKLELQADGLDDEAIDKALSQKPFCPIVLKIGSSAGRSLPGSLL